MRIAKLPVGWGVKNIDLLKNNCVPFFVQMDKQTLFSPNFNNKTSSVACTITDTYNLITLLLC
jgi:hypothetical protein